MKPTTSLRLLLPGLMLPILASAQHFDTPLSHGIDPREVQFYEANPYLPHVTRGETTPARVRRTAHHLSLIHISEPTRP